MTTTSLTVWNEDSDALVDKSEMSPPVIVGPAQSLTSRDQAQIVTAFEADSYEMVSGFVLNKALAQLKKQLASLGMEFVGEMIGRQDLDEDSVPTVEISNFEAINLAKELGMMTSLDAKRLSLHTELLAHIDGLEAEEAELSEMTREEALAILRTSVNSILGRRNNYAPTSFLEFRAALENRTFKENDPDINSLIAAPYFFRKTTLSILLSGVKSKSGAQFEHTLGNILVVIPIIWESLRDNERWSVGQAYAEAVAEGNRASMIALRKALTSVHGFDFVPESLRSQTYSAAASSVIQVHGQMNNFYNEPSAIAALVKLGTTIPWPAFPISMTATMCVFLGNSYGISNAAQTDARKLLKRLTQNQWTYFLNECLPSDRTVLSKLAWSTSPQERWATLVSTYGLGHLSIKNADSKFLVDSAENRSKLGARAAKMWDNLDQR